MQIYILIIILISLLALKYDGKEYSCAKNRWFYTVLLILIFLSGFRGDIGRDTIVYHNWFENLQPIDKLTWQTLNQIRFELLFTISCSICKYISDEWLFPQFLFSILINYPIFVFIKKNTTYCFLAVLLYFLTTFYVLNCEEIRQSISFSLILIGLLLWKSKSIYYYYFLAIISIGFHSSAIVFLFLPILPNLFTKPKALFISFIFIYILAALFRDNMYVAVAFLGVDYFTDQAYNYLGSDYVTKAVYSIQNTINRIVLGVALPLLFYFMSKKEKQNYFQLFLFYLFFYIANIQMTLFYRYVHSLQIASIIALMNGLVVENKKYKFFMILLLVLYSYTAISNAIWEYDNTIDQYRYELFVPYKVYTIK